MDSTPPSSIAPTDVKSSPTNAEPSRVEEPASSSPHRSLFRGRIAAVGWLLLLVVPVLIMPFDGQISRWIYSLDLPGDIEKDMDAIQQFGQLGSLILIFVLIFLLEPPTIRRTLLDLGLAMLVAVLIALFLKTIFGRTRPWVSETNTSVFLGPGWGDNTERDWHTSASMPSSHSVAAAVLAVYLAWIRPRLAILAVILAALVAIWRVRVQAHFVSDVAAGLLLGALVATPIIQGHWGVRSLDWIWKRFVDREAQPAVRDVEESIQSRQPKKKRKKNLRPYSPRLAILALIFLAVILLLLSVVHRDDPSSKPADTPQNAVISPISTISPCKATSFAYS